MMPRESFSFSTSDTGSFGNDSVVSWMSHL